MMSLFATFAISGLGVAVFVVLGLPLPWLLGPIFASLTTALLGVPLRGVKQLNNFMRTILGVAVGATLTPAVIVTMSGYWPSLLMIPVMVAAIGATGVPYFQKLWGFDFPTAYYATMPGGLQDMLVFGEEAGGDVRAISLVHATRVLVIVTILPFLLAFVWDADLTNPPGAPAASIPLSQLAIMLACSIVGWRLAKRIGLFGASILGPMIAAAAAAMSGILEHRPPAEAIWAAQFFIGMVVGVKYTGVTIEEVRRVITAALGFCAILIVLTIIFAEIVYAAGFGPAMETVLAFAPGGQAELTVLAIIVGADLSFVISHHILRLFSVILGAPIAAKFFQR